MEELKLCPFCGGEADWSAGIGWFAIVCQTCFVETEAYSSADDAQGVWNRRASLVQGTEATEGGGAVRVCHETYAAIGSILRDMAGKGHPQAEKLLDNLSEARLVHADVLPFAHEAGVRVDAAADEVTAASRFCDGNCTWRDHHPDCPIGGTRGVIAPGAGQQG
jgi:hypothetical protein